jgi:hypothetical protein
MSKITLNDTVSIDELRVVIPQIGKELTPIILSEPGCGKTSLLSMIASDNGDKWRKVGDYYESDKYDYIYVDCPVKDMADVGMTIPNHASKQLEYYVSDLFQMNTGKPKVILLDEFMKSPKLLQVVFTRLMLERCVGDTPLTTGSIVFGTSNNASDGVGDSMLAHAGNRVCILPMAKPSAKEWLLWASNNKINRLIRAWVAMTPKCLNSYTTGDQDDNEFIFNPKKHQLSFCSPRSLARSSVIVDKKDMLGDNATMVALAGTIGLSAAKQMSAFLSLEKQLPDFKDVVKSPEKVEVPDDIAALLMMMFQAVDVVETQEELSKFMQFVSRIKSSEVQAIFFTMMMRVERATKLARGNKDIMLWAKDNHELLG